MRKAARRLNALRMRHVWNKPWIPIDDKGRALKYTADAAGENTDVNPHNSLENAPAQVGETLEIKPDVVGDFREMPFSDGAFRLVVFDPPHLIHAGESSWLAKKYGKLDRETWQEDLKAGFRECFRVLEPGGVLVFKWCEDQVSTAEVLKLASHEPLFGHRRGKTVFLVFMKSTTPN